MFTYLSRANMGELVQHLPDVRPEFCCGFKIRPITDNGSPVANLHYDPLQKTPITELCHHVDNECQPYAEQAFILIAAYAIGDINDELWKHLFPTKSSCSSGPGIPTFAMPHGECCGFKLCQGSGIKVSVQDQGLIRSGFEIEPTTHSPFTIPCDQSPCVSSAPYDFALYKAYACYILADSGFDTVKSHMQDPKYVIENFGWRKHFNDPSLIGACSWKRILLQESLWLRNQYTGPASQNLWDPSTLVKFNPHNPECTESRTETLRVRRRLIFLE